MAVACAALPGADRAGSGTAAGGGIGVIRASAARSAPVTGKNARSAGRGRDWENAAAATAVSAVVGACVSAGTARAGEPGTGGPEAGGPEAAGPEAGGPEAARPMAPASAAVIIARRDRTEVAGGLPGSRTGGPGGATAGMVEEVTCGSAGVDNGAATAAGIPLERVAAGRRVDRRVGFRRCRRPAGRSDAEMELCGKS
jgi:hypothetical protein